MLKVKLFRNLKEENGVTTRSQVIFIFVFFVLLLSGYGGLAVAQEPDLIVFNGKIATVDEKPLFQTGPSQFGGNLVEAVAIKDGTVIAVGTDGDILRLAGSDTKKLDVQGRTVLPGLIDVHRHITGFMPEDFPEVRGVQVPPSHDRGVVRQGIEEALRKKVQEVKPGEWIIVNPTGDTARQLILFQEITRADLDGLAPENPVMLNETGSGANSQILFNSKAREIIENELPVFKKFSDHDLIFDGVNVSAIVIKDILLKGRDKDYAKSIKKLLIAISLPKGVTTIGTRILRTPLNALFILDRRGEMPMRYGWFFSDGSYYNPEGFYKRFPEMSGVGSDYLWNIGVGEEVTDSPSTGLCTTIPTINPEFKARLEKARIDPCFLHNPIKRATVKDQIQYGRGVEFHASGDKTADLLLEIIEEIQRETGMTDQQIRDKRLTFEHLHMIRLDQIPKLKRFGIIMSHTPSYMRQNLDPTKPANVLQNYGEQYLKWHLPARSFIEAGVKTVLGEMFTDPFGAMKMLITREACFTPRLPGQGEIGVEKCKVLAPEQRIDRVTALKMVTTWAAYYMLKENELGSLEVGRLADFVVIDRDYFTIPEKEIADLKVLLTAIGGEVVYASPDFGPLKQDLFKGPEFHGKAQLIGVTDSEM
jgi:predicted amidohydrolase YtcJ